MSGLVVDGLVLGVVGRRCLLVVVVLLLVVCGGLVGGVGRAGAVVAAAPSWRVTDVGYPSFLPVGVGHRGRYVVAVENVGGKSSEGEIAVKDVLPVGLTVTGVRAEPELGPKGEKPSCLLLGELEVVCSFHKPTAVVPSGFLVVMVEYVVSGAVSGSLTDAATVSGGGAASVSGQVVTPVVGEHESSPPGVASFGFEATGPAGEPFTQAAGHPNFLTTTLLLNDVRDENVVEEFKPAEPTKDLIFYLPVGLLGDPAVAEPCPVPLVEAQSELSGCPQGSRVGTILPMVVNNIFANTQDPTHEHGIYSVTPEQGYAAEFAFAANNITFLMYASVVRRDGVYALRIAVPGVPPLASFVGAVATFYGDLQERFFNGAQEVVDDRGAFLTMPSDCEEGASAREAGVEMDTWKEPGVMLSASTMAFPALEGCDLLNFSSSLTVQPQTTLAEAPSGDEIGLKVAQTPNGGSGVGSPPVRKVRLDLPAGVTISPSSANGLEACQESGPEGIDIEGAGSEEVAPDGLARPVAGHCPEASQIGTVKASTPLLSEQLEGHLFLAAPLCGGAGQAACTEEDARTGRLFRLYLELQAPGAGVVIKLAGVASVDPATGRVSAEFDENPEFPFSVLTVSMTRGARAPLANPQACGVARSEALVGSWTAVAPVAQPSDFFTVDWDGAGGGCPGVYPFAPGFTAGTESRAAGATSPFILELGRQDREQNVLSLSTTLPAGLLAYVSRVGQCPEPQASEARLDACPSSSQIGTASVAVGSGSSPYHVTGKVYLTGRYEEKPFGLSVVVPATAGPFNLGDVLVRASLSIDPRTAQVTARSTAFPQMLDGVPLRLRAVKIVLDSKEFTLNPTSCAAMAITGVVQSAGGGQESVSAPFSAQDCKSLPFKPVLSASTEAKSTKAEGTGVSVKLSYPTGNVGVEANIAKVELTFPSQLPARLETLQRACLATVFQANPAGCPAASNVGTAVVHTPILTQPLMGPVYLVSHGNASFPSVVFVLQGENGVTLDVEGESFISQKGVLKVTFNSVPDAPFTTFETTLPAKQFSQFTSARTTGRAQASQCGENLIVPFTMVAQNGAELSEKAKMKITGCKPAKPSVTLRKTTAGKHALAVTVKTSQRGRLRISGEGLKTMVLKGLAAGVHKLNVRYTVAGQRIASRRGKTRLAVQLVVGRQVASKHKRVAL